MANDEPVGKAEPTCGDDQKVCFPTGASSKPVAKSIGKMFISGISTILPLYSLSSAYTLSAVNIIGLPVQLLFLLVCFPF